MLVPHGKVDKIIRKYAAAHAARRAFYKRAAQRAVLYIRSHAVAVYYAFGRAGKQLQRVARLLFPQYCHAVHERKQPCRSIAGGTVVIISHGPILPILLTYYIIPHIASFAIPRRQLYFPL